MTLDSTMQQESEEFRRGPHECHPHHNSSANALRTRRHMPCARVNDVQLAAPRPLLLMLLVLLLRFLFVLLLLSPRRLLLLLLSPALIAAGGAAAATAVIICGSLGWWQRRPCTVTDCTAHWRGLALLLVGWRTLALLLRLLSPALSCLHDGEHPLRMSVVLLGRRGRVHDCLAFAA